MTLSAELQSRYTTEVDVDWRHAFVLSHPYATTHYLISHTEPVQGLVDGNLQTFSPVPTQIQFPTRDDSGRQEFALLWCGIGREAKTFLDQAIRGGTIAITCRYTVYLLGSLAPQIDPFVTMSLTNISLSEDAVMATATRADILNRPFPTEVYRLSKFPGLRRQ